MLICLGLELWRSLLLLDSKSYERESGQGEVLRFSPIYAIIGTSWVLPVDIQYDNKMWGVHLDRRPDVQEHWVVVMVIIVDEVNFFYFDWDHFGLAHCCQKGVVG